MQQKRKISIKIRYLYLNIISIILAFSLIGCTTHKILQVNYIQNDTLKYVFLHVNQTQNHFEVTLQEAPTNPTFITTEIFIMAETKVYPCNCKSEFQDKLYGKGLRLFNMRDPKKHKGEGTCTICGTKKSF